MAYVTPIGSNPEQIEYRLGGAHGCGEPGKDHQLSYHADGRERPLRWIGAGLSKVGIEAGTELTEEQFDDARAIMNGQNPHTGEQLIELKLAVPADAKVSLPALVNAIRDVATERGVRTSELFTSQFNRDAYARAERAVTSKGEAASLRADHAGLLADEAGLDADKVWGGGVYAAAAANLTEVKTVVGPDGTAIDKTVPRRIAVGNRGYDVSITLPKSYSLLLAFAPEETALAVEALYTEQVGNTFDWLEQQTAYGMRGHHGDGKTADTVRGSGFLGWAMVHRAARPVNGRIVGDPHWHVHLTVANMTRGLDGKWSTVAAGGRDLMRHVPAVDHLMQALVRRELHERHGVEFTRSERTGLWEIAAIPDEVLRDFSKRGIAIDAMLRDLGFDPESVSRQVKRMAQDKTREGKTEVTTAPDATLRDLWQAEARELGHDPDALAAAALAGSSEDQPAAPERGDRAPERTPDQVREETITAVVARLLDEERGVTAHQRRFTPIDAIRAAADALPNGAASIEELTELVDVALTRTDFVLLPERSRGTNGERSQIGASHMQNAERYTTADVVRAERIILGAAATSHGGQNLARVNENTADMARSTVEAAQGFELSAEQAAVMRNLVTSGRALDTVLGPPGTGKTTLMRAARTAWEAGGHVVAGAATAAVAAQNLDTESGIPSLTVAQWVHRIREGQGLTGVDVLVLDEANLTDDRDRACLYEEAARTGTKVVEIGDPKQLRGVGCGSLFGAVHNLVQGQALSENRRQREEDERQALDAWRAGRFADALSTWSDKGRLVATDTPEQALTAMVGEWMRQRAGAPDPHAEMRGVVMLAGTNEAVDRLNEAAQAVRAAAGELGPGRSYALPGAHTVQLHEGDHVMLRINDRRQELHTGPAGVLNGYRGVVEGIEDSGALRVAWQEQTEDGYVARNAVLKPEYIANGGVSLGYAMTIHKAEGLTVSADWAQPDERHQGGTVLVYAPGADEAGQYVAGSRHKDKVFFYGALEQLESPETAYLEGAPRDAAERTHRVIAALAEQAARQRAHGYDNDKPVLEDLQKMPTPINRDEPTRRQQAAVRHRVERERLDEQQRAQEAAAHQRAADRAASRADDEQLRDDQDAPELGTPEERPTDRSDSDRASVAGRDDATDRDNDMVGDERDFSHGGARRGGTSQHEEPADVDRQDREREREDHELEESLELEQELELARELDEIDHDLER